ncbi:11833_t:CDS:2 [Acaulospora colombiana]|uniref:11833_t:CDS:1 n=1 Tax=Acaulospora colombiana TaxID=27376 RepID=A0ACA9LEE8_9GLOM|nr:11833_t:CDS:2 [Acaulospora colombiana]
MLQPSDPTTTINHKLYARYTNINPTHTDTNLHTTYRTNKSSTTMQQS